MFIQIVDDYLRLRIFRLASNEPKPHRYIGNDDFVMTSLRTLPRGVPFLPPTPSTSLPDLPAAIDDEREATNDNTTTLTTTTRTNGNLGQDNIAPVRVKVLFRSKMVDSVY